MKKYLQMLFTPVILKNVLADLMIAIPRIVGCYCLFNFGWSKFPAPDWFIQDVTKFGLPFPFLLAWAAVITESIGAIFLILGLGTRFWGFMLTCTMLVALFFQKWNSEMWEKLPCLGFLWLAIYAMVLGPGRFGLDYWISKRFFKIG
jgi:putative oxidoreductase